MEIILILTLIFIIGLCVGSFLNVVVLRALSEESIVFPASKCPKCQAKLKWWHNIPVLSYIFLRGKCGFCKDPISIQYPIVELVTGLLFVIIFVQYGINWALLIALAIACTLVVIAGTDIKEKVVFDVHSYILVGLGLLNAAILTFDAYTTTVSFQWLSLNNPLINSILGIVAGIVIMEAAARAGYLVAGTRAFGEGDTFIAAGLGAIFGWAALLVILAASVLIQVVFTLPIFVKKLFAQKDYKTIILTVVFSVSALAFWALQARMPQIVYAILAVLLAIVGVTLCVLILRGLRKETPEEMTYLPFGPAMVIAGLATLIIFV